MIETGEISLSVVVVSDFEASRQKTWRDEIRILRALARQDVAPGFEVILVENQVHRDDHVPAEVYDAVHNLRLEFCAADSSAAMKDYGVACARGEWIAVVEADCTPAPDWLRLLLAAARKHGEMDVVSGLTNYGETTSYRRVLNLLDRSLNDSGISRECSFVSNNGAIYRASVLRRFPYPEAITPFLSAQLRNREMKKCGHRFYFERDATMRHEVGGLAFIRDYRMNMGHMQMSVEVAPSLRRVAALSARNFVKDLHRLRWLGRRYLRWRDWPLAAVMVLVVRVPEALGMFYAVRQVRALPHTAYR